MTRPEWNTRFYLSESRNNQKVHEYFRQYFDKPERRRQEKISLPLSPIKFYPNLKSSLEKYSRRIPRVERLGVSDKKTRELGWNSCFHVKVSKDNERYYNTYREYFDSPRVLDYNKTVSVPIPVSVIGIGKGESLRHGSADPWTTWNNSQFSNQS